MRSRMTCFSSVFERPLLVRAPPFRLAQKAGDDQGRQIRLPIVGQKQPQRLSVM